MAKEAKSGKANSNIIVIILAVLLIITIVFGVIYFQKYSMVSNEKPNASVDCGSMPSSYIKDACYTQLAVNAADVSSCESIANDDQRDLCYTEVSKVLRNRTVCDNISDKFYSRPKCYAELQMIGVE